jgi:MFS transporter, PPP family, 3-phenylpropionic acid transporter
MINRHGALARFVLLYCGLFSAFGLVSPFLPAFLAARGLAPEELGLVLGAGTAVRLICGPIAGRLADRFHIFRAELAIAAVLAASAALLYFEVKALWMSVIVSLFQAGSRTACSPRGCADSRACPCRPSKQARQL